MARKKFWTYVKTTPDRYLSTLCMGGWGAEVNPNARYEGVGLFNEGQSGKLHVYTISFTFTGSDYAVGVIQPSAAGSRVASCFPVDPTGQGPAAGIYHDSQGAISPPFVSRPVPANTRIVFGSGGFAVDKSPNHPLAILPPGWSLTIYPDSQSSDFGVGFWFCVI